jgi:hypothetical protein
LNSISGSDENSTKKISPVKMAAMIRYGTISLEANISISLLESTSFENEPRSVKIRAVKTSGAMMPAPLLMTPMILMRIAALSVGPTRTM